MRLGTKRLISLLLALVMVCSLAVVPAAAEEDFAPQSPDAAPASAGTPITVNVTSSGGVKSIYANNPANASEEALKAYVANSYTFTGAYEIGGNTATIPITAEWSGLKDINGNPKSFNPKGFQGWLYGGAYYQCKAAFSAAPPLGYTFQFQPESGGSGLFLVVAVMAAQTFGTPYKTVDRAVMKKDTFTIDDLGLPETVDVTYAAYREDAPGGFNPDTVVGKLEQEDGQYRITGWKIGGEDLTVETLRAAAGSSGYQDLKLTPVYAAGGEDAVPVWATLEEKPQFTLTVGEGSPAEITVTPPADITYGSGLGDPTAAATVDGVPLTDARFEYRYTGRYHINDYYGGTPYDSTDKPTQAGEYQVIATLIHDTCSGKSTSATSFTISPKPVTITDITIEDKEYSGGTSADVGSAVINGKVDGDTLKVSIEARFQNKDVGTNRRAIIYYSQSSLYGEDAPNYTIDETNSQHDAYANITAKKVSVYDKNFSVTKQYDGTTSPGTKSGSLDMTGRTGNDNIFINNDKVTVGPYTDPEVGRNKTVLLSNITLFGDDVNNYTIDPTYAFTRAEITSGKSAPALGTDFTVDIPSHTYDGQPHAAAVTPRSEGLGAYTVTYGKWYGSYAGYTDTKVPVNAGEYVVYVSFEEGENFAYADNIEAGRLVINKAKAAAEAGMTVVSNEREWFSLYSLVNTQIYSGPKLREKLELTSGKGLVTVTGAAGDSSFTVTARPTLENASDQFLLPLTSDNYDLDVTVFVTIQVGELVITPPKASVRGGGVGAPPPYGTPLKNILVLEGGSAAVGGVEIPGTFALKEAETVFNSGEYKDYTLLVTFTSTDQEYTGEAQVKAAFTIAKAGSAAHEAYISVSNGETKTIKIDETFINSNMAKGAKIKTAPAMDPGGGLIESCTAPAGAAEFTLTSKNDAPNGSTQTFTLVLTSDNYETVNVSVTVYNDHVVVTGAQLKGDKAVFPSGTVLSRIVDLSGCTATVNNVPAAGEFALVNPDQELTGPDTYTDWSVDVWFTADNGTKYQVRVSVPEFRINEPGGGDDDTDEHYLKNGYFITIFANSQHNQRGESLLNLVKTRKGSYTVGGKTYTAAWRADNNAVFEPKGYEENVWYSYTAALSPANGESPRAYVRVIPVNSKPLQLAGGSGKTVKAEDIRALTEQNWKTALGLPSELVFQNEPAEEVEEQDPKDKFKETDRQTGCGITGWRMDGRALTLAALKSKAESAASANREVKVNLTPAYTPLAWATVKGAPPTFELTITPKIPVDVTWSGPASPITYGEKLELGTPKQTEKDGGGVDETGTFQWDYVYYKADGTTRLDQQPTDVGAYQVQAVLNSRTHSGASALKGFEIKAKSVDGFAFTPPENMRLIYNKRPQTPEYTVKDGATVLGKNTDYTVEYSDNTNAGTAKVTFTGVGNYTGTKTVGFVIGKLALTKAQLPVVSGSAAVGQVLSASLADVDAAELEWTWTVGGAEAAGCTAASYEVEPEDSNKVITAAARAKADGNYSDESGVSNGVTVAKFPVAGAVTITAANTDADGRIAANTTLTAAVRVTPDAAKIGGAWSWKVNGTVRTDANSAVYTVAEGDREIIAVFTPNDNYAGSIESAKIEVGRIPLAGKVSIAGTGDSVGSRLTASVTGGPALEEGKTFAYAWLRDGRPISGAAGAEYTVAAADRGRTISVKVTADGCTGELVSEGTAIPAVAPGRPGVSVTAGDGRLTVSWTAPDDGGAPITGYKLTVTTGDTPITILDVTLAANVVSYTLEGLTNSTQYDVSVEAFNKMDYSEPGTAAGIPKASGGSGGGNGGGSGGGGGGFDNNPTIDRATTVTQDGGKVTVETKKDGTVVTTVQNKDGSSGVTVIAPSGQTTATVRLPASVAGRAANGGGAVTLPIQGVYASQNIGRAPTVTINASGVKGVKVDIPLAGKSTGIVAVLMESDGTERIIKNTIPTRDGIAIRVNSGDTIKILDNSMSFADTRGHWAADAVNFVSARGLFYGTGVNAFSPNAKMTRGMLVTVLARYADVDTVGGATWHEKGAAWAVANGLSDGTGLDNNITREQLITIIYRYAVLAGKLRGTDADLRGYADANRVSGYAVDAMSWAVGAGLIKGVTPTTLEPQGGATRAQMAVIIMRYAELFGL